MVVSDSLEDWFPYPSPDGKKLVYIAYPAGTPTYDPGTLQIEIKLVAVNHDKIATTQKILYSNIISEDDGQEGNIWAKQWSRVSWVGWDLD
jgi:TolB protein